MWSRNKLAIVGVSTSLVVGIKCTILENLSMITNIAKYPYEGGRLII